MRFFSIVVWIAVSFFSNWTLADPPPFVVGIYNSGFEISHPSDPQVPDGWSVVNGGPVRTDSTVVHCGRKSLVLTSKGDRQEVMTPLTFAIENHLKIQVQVWTHGQNIKGSARLVVFWFDPSIRSVGSQVLELPVGTHPWKQSCFTVTPPVQAGRVGLHIELLGSGELRVDDIRITQMAGRNSSPSTTDDPVYLPVDISEQVNMAFIDDRDGDGKGGWTDQGDNDLRNFPRGRQTFGGVPFDILDPDSKGRPAVIMLGSRRNFPNEKVLSAVPARFTVLHILHAAAWINNGKVGDYILRYGDGTEAKIDVVADTHLADWWYPQNLPQAPVAWYGSNRIRDLVSVWLMSWVNPHPEKDVTAIVLKSSGAVIGICGITTQQGGPLPNPQKVPAVQITLTPESVVLNRGQSMKVHAAFFHGGSEPLTSNVNRPCIAVAEALKHYYRVFRKSRCRPSRFTHWNMSRTSWIFRPGAIVL